MWLPSGRGLGTEVLDAAYQDETAPGFLVFDVPWICDPPAFGGRTLRPRTRILLPLLTIRTTDGSVLVPDEALSWSQHLASKEVPTSQIRRRLNAVGRVYEFAETVADEQISRPGVMDLIVWEYLRARIETPVDPSARRFPHWQPVQYEVVRTEFRDLVDFGRWCANYTGPSSPMGAAFKAGADIWRGVSRKLAPTDLLSHLEAQRTRWHAAFGEDRPITPSGLKRLAANGSGKSKGDTTLSIEEVDAIIDREQNPMFKALWIELAYLGPRVSEALNHWRCDVLDGSYARKLFSADVHGPLVVFAHPSKSRYTGSFGRAESVKDRKQVLSERYGLVPRPDAVGRKQRLGWKGMMVFNAELWITHGTWTCPKRAAEFGQLFHEILDIHRQLGTEAMHPYLYINSRSAAHSGEPSKIGNIEDAFDRACVRAGVVPHSPGAHLHGLRHFYRWYSIHELKLSEEIVQSMMRQTSPLSQRVYGKRSQDMHDAMSSITERGR